MRWNLLRVPIRWTKEYVVPDGLASTMTRPPASGKRAVPELPVGGTIDRLEALRGHFRADEADRLVVVTLRIRMAHDHWLGRFSTAHPQLRIEALHWASIDEGTSVLDYWIEGLPGGRWAAEIASNPDVRSVDPLAESGEGGLYRVVQRMNPVVHLYRRLRLPLRFPMAIRGGSITWEVMGKKTELDAILEFFRTRKLAVVIASVRRSLEPGHLPVLTPHQRQLLAEALRAGYFAVPRGITLTGLARRLGRSKSAVSESLAHIERKLLEGSLDRVSRPRPSHAVG